MELTSSFVDLLPHFASVFTAPTYQTFVAIVAGWVLSQRHRYVTEVIFAYPGLGWLIFNSIKSLDYPVIQGSVLLIILSVALANFLIDIAYPLIDPRIRYERAGS